MQFASLAGTNVAFWMNLIAIDVHHSSYGCGRLLSIVHDPLGNVGSLMLRFADGLIRAISPDDFRNGTVTRLELSKDYVEQYHADIRRAEEERHEAQVQEQEWRRQQELQEQERSRRVAAEAPARRQFEQLKKQYNVSEFKDSSPTSFLYAVLLRMEDRSDLTSDQIEQLKSNRLHTVLATYYYRRFKMAANVWELVKACAQLRKADRPDDAIRISDVPPLMEDADAASALLTTRGGALRDLKCLSEAEACARRAIELNDTKYQPYSLLGAICYQNGAPEEGERYFRAASQRGADESKHDWERKRALCLANLEERDRVARYLLSRDPVRYAWAREYLSSSPPSVDSILPNPFG
jgi:hypothetical protein